MGRSKLTCFETEMPYPCWPAKLGTQVSLTPLTLPGTLLLHEVHVELSEHTIPLNASETLSMERAD